MHTFDLGVSTTTLALGQVIYASAAVRPFSLAEVHALLDVSRRNNGAHNLTGMLLYDEGSFLQVLEGPDEALRVTYERICADARHHRIVRITHEPIVERSFGDWEMGFGELQFRDLVMLPGVADSFTRAQCYTDIGEDAARRVLHAFSHGMWRTAMR